MRHTQIRSRQRSSHTLNDDGQTRIEKLRSSWAWDPLDDATMAHRRVLWLAETHWRLRLGSPAHRFIIAAEGPAITEALAKLGRKSSSAQQLWQHCHRHGKVDPDDPSARR
jgi:hypothetical protein